MAEEQETLDAGVDDERGVQPIFTLAQIRFIEAYMADPERNIKRACDSIGVHDNSATRWLQMEHIQKEIAYRENKRLKKGLLTVQKVTDWTVQVIRRCMQKRAVKAPDGRIIAYKFDATNALNGCKLLYQVFGVIGGSSKVEEEKLAERERTMTARDIVPLLREAQRLMAEEDGTKQFIVQDAIADAEAVLTQVQADPHENEPVPLKPDEEPIPLDRFAGVKNIRDYMSQIRKGELGKVVD